MMPSSLVDFAVQTLVPLLVAVCLGGIVGWERESWRKPAGLRTHMMVALGAAAFTRLALRAVMAVEYSGVTGGDPSRIIEGVATGIGFLGAGSIIHSRGEVQGITTAAGVWVVGAVGACCGAGYYAIAVVAVLLSVIVLAVLPKMDLNVTEEKRDDADKQPSGGR